MKNKKKSHKNSKSIQNTEESNEKKENAQDNSDNDDSEDEFCSKKALRYNKLRQKKQIQLPNINLDEYVDTTFYKFFQRCFV